jgi:hypothetical protein
MQTGLTPPIEDNIRPFVEAVLLAFQYWPILLLAVACIILWILTRPIDEKVER